MQACAAEDACSHHVMESVCGKNAIIPHMEAQYGKMQLYPHMEAQYGKMQLYPHMEAQYGKMQIDPKYCFQSIVSKVYFPKYSFQ